MPELPELELLKENLGHLIVGKRIGKLRILKPYIQKTLIPNDLEGQNVTSVRRRGKYIEIVLEACRIVVHLMLSGRFRIEGVLNGRMPSIPPSGIEPKEEKPPHATSAFIEFESGNVLYMLEDATIKKMSMWVLPMNQSIDSLRELGPEPLSDDFTPDKLAGLLQTSREGLKNFLLNQKNIAGIGNAYADEICWRAELSPFKKASKLTRKETMRLHKAIHDTLIEAIAETRKVVDDKIEIDESRPFMAVHRRKGQPCPRCGTRVEWVSTQARDTYYCPRCQTQGKVLADGRTSKFLK